MTGDEFRKILDRFAAALSEMEEWAEAHRHMGEQHPRGNVDLHRVWLDLSGECKRKNEMERRAAMKDAADPIVPLDT